MSVKVKIDNFGIATVTNGKWRAHPVTKALLVGIDEERLNEEVVYYPHLDLGLAEMAISELGGAILKVTDAPKYEAGVIY